MRDVRGLLRAGAPVHRQQVHPRPPELKKTERDSAGAAPTRRCSPLRGSAPPPPLCRPGGSENPPDPPALLSDTSSRSGATDVGVAIARSGSAYDLKSAVVLGIIVAVGVTSGVV